MSLLSSIRNWLGGSDPFDDELGNLTPRAIQVFALARKEARALNHTYVGTEHMLLGLLLEGDGIAAKVLKNLGVEEARTREVILSELDPSFGLGPESSGHEGGNPK